MSFKDFSTFSAGGHFVQWSGMILNNFLRGSPKGHFCEIILKSGHWSWRRCHFKVFLFRSAEWNDFRNFGQGFLIAIYRNNFKYWDR